MKIKLFYENKNYPTTFEIPEEEFKSMIEADYQQQFLKAKNKSEVKRRSPQEIMDEVFNKPTFNKNQTESRRHVHLNALDPEDKHLSNGVDILADLIERESYEELYEAIDKLKPQQKKLLYEIFWDDKKQKDIAARDNVSERAITGRMKKIYTALKKILN